MNIFDLLRIIIVVVGLVISFAKKRDIFALLSVGAAFMLFGLEDIKNHHMVLGIFSLLCGIALGWLGVYRDHKKTK
ncbi:MAG TPA: hypothetical protein VMR45_02320 [Patescibacteria group bacterium]|jgi:hypothetical protein|nr:hypothetical protein [Patescibacteria group bacterium]